MQTHQDINLAEFLSVLIYVSEECGKVIRKVKETGGHKVTASKDDESPVTEADLIVQKTIEVCLNTLYPTLRVEGEESPESIKQKVPAVSPE
jgi:3'-phosphoadenosine 5'-phosphosulfate (PAPS) 3'-phosphatase